MRSALLTGMLLLIAGLHAQQSPTPPYGPSPVARGVEFDWSTHHRAAQGSDNFQLTWSADGHLYGAWGDGGGFGGTNSDGRVSLGVARVEGDWRDYRGVNVWGGKDAERPATVDGKPVDGKSWGMVAVGETLYMWVSPGSPLSDMRREARLYRSQDGARSWTPASWAFTLDDALMIPTICQFGRGYEGARDGYVYHYFLHPRNDISDHIQKPGTVYLARSPKERLMERESYEFFAGMAGAEPRWTRRVEEKQPVFEDRENGVGWVLSVSHNQPLGRYILMTDHTVSNRGNLGIYDAPEPWGPWTTIAYLDESKGTHFGNGHVKNNTFFWSIPTKWLSEDGWSFTMVFTGSGRGQDNDSFNLIRGRFLSR